MLKSKRNLIVLLVIMLAVALATVMASLQTLETKPQRAASDESEIPVVDYAAPAPTDPQEKLKRETRSKRYDNNGFVIEPRKPGGPILRKSPTLAKLSSIPANLSDVIITGDITDSRAYLSTDKTGVYTEFLVRIDEILKDKSGLLKTGEQLAAERIGGRVRFPSGHIQLYAVSKVGMPRTGHRYLLFLSQNDKDESFVIITGYELLGGVVYPLDGVDLPGGATELPQFVPFKGMDGTQLLSRVRTAIVSP